MKDTIKTLSYAGIALGLAIITNTLMGQLGYGVGITFTMSWLVGYATVIAIEAVFGEREEAKEPVRTKIKRATNRAVTSAELELTTSKAVKSGIDVVGGKFERTKSASHRRPYTRGRTKSKRGRQLQ